MIYEYPASNCVLQTIWDNNFLAEDVLDTSEYIAKICVNRPGKDNLLTQTFIPKPMVNVRENAESLGFVHRV